MRRILLLFMQNISYRQLKITPKALYSILTLISLMLICPPQSFSTCPDGGPAPCGSFTDNGNYISPQGSCPDGGPPPCGRFSQNSSNDNHFGSNNRGGQTKISTKKFIILKLSGSSLWIGGIQNDKGEITQLTSYVEVELPCDSSQSCDEFEQKISYFLEFLTLQEVKDYLAARKPYSMSLKKWHGDGHYFYSIAHEYFKNNNMHRAYVLFKYAANKDFPEAQYYLGYCYEGGYGVSMDYTKALYWYKKAAEQGILDAMYNAGVFYTKGRGCNIDYCKAVSFYKTAAEGGFAPAQHNLAVRFLNGQCVQKDFKKATGWLKKAAKQNYTLSINALKKTNGTHHGSKNVANANYKSHQLRANRELAKRGGENINTVSLISRPKKLSDNENPFEREQYLRNTFKYDFFNKCIDKSENGLTKTQRYDYCECVASVARNYIYIDTYNKTGEMRMISGYHQKLQETCN